MDGFRTDHLQHLQLPITGAIFLRSTTAELLQITGLGTNPGVVENTGSQECRFPSVDFRFDGQLTSGERVVLICRYVMPRS